jgi:hypothetical protein
MAETLISPGVLARENDQSQITSQPVQAGAAIIGPTVKGKPYIPTLVTSYTEYLATFGSTFISASNEYSFLTSISAYNYFQNGGTSLLVTRVTSGTFTPATSSKILNSETVTGGIEATGSETLAGVFVDGHEARIAYDGTTYRFVASANPIPEDDQDGNLYFFSTGSSAAIAANNLKNEINSALSGSVASSSLDLLVATTSSATLILSASAVGTAFNGITLSTGSASSFATQITLGGGVNGVGNSDAFVLETLGKGAILNSSSSLGTNGDLASGSSDNLRWEIVNPNTSSGVFSVVLRRGDDVTKSKSVLETFTNVSLDPKASNYVARVIGDQVQTLQGSGTTDPYLQTSGNYVNASRYVRVKQVNTPTPDYLDNNGQPKDQYTSSIPAAQSGAFGDGEGSILTGTGKYYDAISNTDTQGLAATDYTDAINLLANKDDFKYNQVSVPGLIYENATHATQLNTLVSNIEGRGDSIIVMDLKNYGATVVGATTTAASLDTSYAAAYWPWVMVTDPDSQQLVWVPASEVV